MADPDAKRAGEGGSGYLFNLSAGLMAAAGARFWVKADADFAGSVWLACATVLLWLAWSVLYLLEPEIEGC